MAGGHRPDRPCGKAVPEALRWKLIETMPMLHVPPLTCPETPEGSVMPESRNKKLVCQSPRAHRRRTFAAAIVVWMMLIPAFAGAQSPEIYLQLGYTTGDDVMANAIAFSPDGALLAAVSGSTTIRIWETVAGREIRTLSGHSGSVKSLAFLPDNHRIVSGGTDNMVRLWDVRTGGQLRLFRGHQQEVRELAVSPDGSMLASLDREAMRVWDIASGELVLTLPAPGDEGSSSGSVFPLYSMAFTPDNARILLTNQRGVAFIVGIRKRRVLSTLSNSDLSCYTCLRVMGFRRDGRAVIGGGSTLIVADLDRLEITKREFKSGSLAEFVTPDGSMIVTRTWSPYRLTVYDTGATERRSIPLDENVTNAAYSPVKRQAAVAALGDNLKLYDLQTGTVLQNFGAATCEPYDCNFSPDGTVITTQVFAPGPKTPVTHQNEIFNKAWSLRTGMEVADTTYPTASEGWSEYDERNRCFYGVRSEKTAYAESPFVDIIRVDAKDKNDISPRMYENHEKWKVVRRFRAHDQHVTATEASFTHGYIVTGSEDRTINLFTYPGATLIRTFRGHLGAVTRLALSPDGTRLLSESRDQTTRLWDVATGTELARFVSFADGEWIVITPEGYFNASPKGATHMNVRVGMDVYSMDNFYEKFFNPVYVASVLQGRKVEAVADIRKGILAPPEVKITSPAPGKEFTTDIATIAVTATDMGGGIDEIRLYHNGKAIGEETRGMKIVPKGNEAIRTYTVTLVDGVNTFRATAFSRDRSESNPYVLTVALAAPQKDVAMHVVAVGINKYKNPALNLNYAEPDARGIVDFFRRQGGGLFKSVDFRELYNEQATKEAILSKLDQLRSTNPQDAVIIYLAGHGENISDKWYFVPYELTYPEREQDIRAKAISSDELRGCVNAIRAQKILLLIDACKSGAVLVAFRGFEDRKAISQLSRSTGMYVVAASAKDQFAAEVKDLGHGVFTYVLLEGLKGKAAARGEPVTVLKLISYISDQLPVMTKKYNQEEQYPVMGSSQGMDFPLVIAN
jgi:WD40 repeat protein